MEDFGLRPPFRVVTHKNWLAEKFKAMGAIQDFGFDIDPSTAYDTTWWAPGAWVASALKAGVRLPLLSNGATWLDKLPREFSGRSVKTMTLQESYDRAPADVKKGYPVFVKLPEAKVDNFPARLHMRNKHWATTMDQYHLPPETLIQMQDPVEFLIEARFWVAHGGITASSMYRSGASWWGEPEFENWVMNARPQVNGCMGRMYEKMRDLLDEVDVAPGCVIDMGLTTDDRCLVVEANAAWSSGPYDGSPEGIYRAIRASHDLLSHHPEWAWKHNPVFDKAGALREVKRT